MLVVGKTPRLVCLANALVRGTTMVIYILRHLTGIRLATALLGVIFSLAFTVPAFAESASEALVSASDRNLNAADPDYDGC